MTAEPSGSSHTLPAQPRPRPWERLLLAVSALGAATLIALLLASDARFGFGSLGFGLGTLLGLLSIAAISLSAATALNRLRARLPEAGWQRWYPSLAFLLLLFVALTVFALLSVSEGDQLNTALLAVILGTAAALLAVAGVLMAASSHRFSAAGALLLNSIALTQLLWLHEQFLSRSVLLLTFLAAISLLLSVSALSARTEQPDETVESAGATGASEAAGNPANSPRPVEGQLIGFWWFIATGLGIALAAVLDSIVRAQGASPAEILTGLALPAEPNGFGQALAQWQWEPLGLVISALLLHWFLKRRSEAAVGGRKTLSTISFALAVALILLITQGPIGVYRPFLFSAASVELMIGAVLVPLLLLTAQALTAPRSARGVPPQAPQLRRLLSPLGATLAGTVFLFSLWGIKWTVLFADQVSSALFGAGLAVLTAAAVVLLAVAAWQRSTLPVLTVILVVNVVLGVSWYLSDTLLLPHHYGAMGWPGQYQVIADQQLGIWVTLVVSTAVLMLLCGLSLVAKKNTLPSVADTAQAAGRHSAARSKAASAHATVAAEQSSLDDYDRQLLAEAAKTKGRE